MMLAPRSGQEACNVMSNHLHQFAFSSRVSNKLFTNFFSVAVSLSLLPRELFHLRIIPISNAKWPRRGEAEPDASLISRAAETLETTLDTFRPNLAMELLIRPYSGQLFGKSILANLSSHTYRRTKLSRPSTLHRRWPPFASFHRKDEWLAQNRQAAARKSLADMQAST